jgi:excisionase family DNA binding protein
MKGRPEQAAPAGGGGRGRDVQWFTLGQAASYLGVADSTVRKWAVDGRLPAFSTPGGHRRFRLADLEAFLEELRVDQPGDERPLVMVVAVNERERAVARFALEEEGYDVVEAATADEALRAIEQGPPDLVLLDVSTQNVDGSQLVARVAERHGIDAVPVIMVADGGAVRRARAARGGGGDATRLVDAAKRVLPLGG